MGLYNDLQTDLAEAFDDDLADATTLLTIVAFEENPTYDPVTGTVTPSETTYTDVRAVPYHDVEGEIMDEHGNKFDTKFLILDSEKKVTAFVLGMKVTYNTDTFRVDGIDTDAAQATHSVFCRKWG